MDIKSISSQSTYGQSKSIPRVSSSQLSARSNSLLIAQLPKAGSSPGLGLSVDIYDIVGQQGMGLLTNGGRSSMQIANISLGNDMSQKPKWNTEEAASTPAEEIKPAPTPDTPAPKPSIMDKILTESGYVAPAANPYVVQKDFFAS